MQTIKLEPNYLIFLETPCAGNKFPTFKLFRDIFTTLPEITISKIEFPTSNICKVYTELKEYLGPRFLSFSSLSFSPKNLSFEEMFCYKDILPLAILNKSFTV